ncbi:FecCD family ABC transporter permease [Oscillospiraceae bacterium LCP25S3_F9]
MFGINSGDKLTTEKLTITLPRSAIESFKSGIETSAYVNVMMNSDQSFIVKFTDLKFIGSNSNNNNNNNGNQNSNNNSNNNNNNNNQNNNGNSSDNPNNTGNNAKSNTANGSSDIRTATSGNYTCSVSMRKATDINSLSMCNPWDDVRVLALFCIVGLVLALLCIRWCDLMGLEDRTVRGLGINVNLVRLLVSITAVLLVSGTTAIVGPISFLGLLVPHIGRIFVGSEHKFLIPFSTLLGAFIFLAADTLGRTVAYPYEINASIIMSVVGGIAFVILLKRSDHISEK